MCRLPARLTRAIDNPAASLDPAPRKATEQPAIEAPQDIGCNAQYNLPLQCDPKTTAIALHPAHSPFEQGKARAMDLLRLEYR